MNPILVASDLSGRADRAIERALMLGTALETEVVLLTVLETELPQDAVRQSLRAAHDRLASHLSSLQIAGGLRHFIRTETGQPWRKIAAVAEELAAGMILVGMHRADGFLDVFRGTTVARLTRASDTPVLLVRNHPDRDYTRALVCTDFSPASHSALDMVRLIAPQAERTLLHAYAIPFRGYLLAGSTPGEFSASDTARGYDREAREEMAGFMRDSGEEASRSLVAEAGFLELLYRTVSAQKPDLVALGAHARSCLGRALIGSSAEQILNEPPTDVLIV